MGEERRRQTLRMVEAEVNCGELIVEIEEHTTFKSHSSTS